MVLTSIFNAKRIIAVLGAVIFFVVSCKDDTNNEKIAGPENVHAKSLVDPKFSNQIDSIQLYFKRYQLLKMSKIIYNLEPTVKENSFEDGVLTFYKGLLFDELNDPEKHQKETERLVTIAQSIEEPNQKALLASFIYNNKMEKTSSGSKEQLKLILSSLDTLETIDHKFRDRLYYFRKGSAMYLLAGHYLENKDYEKANHYSDLTLRLMDSTKVPYNKVYSFYIKGLVLANQKKPEDALEYYHQIIGLAEKNHATRFLRNVYPVLNTSYNELGDFQSAAKYMLKYKMTNDTILSRQKQATDFVIAKEKELDQKAENKKRFIIIVSVLVLMILLFFTGKKLLKNKTKTEVAPFINVTITDTVSQEDLHELVELSKNNENVFYLKFPEYNPLLIKDLNGFSPKLSDSEIKFCMYLSMKYTVKEIALYTNTSIKSVESKKYRLKKKINTPESEELAKRLNL